MRLSIKNLGVVRKGEIELNGITVLAGENGTGKSTFGKALYCCFRTFYQHAQQVRSEREVQLRSLLFRYVDFEETEDRTELLIDNEVERILSSYEKTGKVSLSEETYKKVIRTDKEQLRKRIQKVLEVDSSEILSNIFGRTMDTEFGRQQAPANHPRKTVGIQFEWKQGEVIDIKRNTGKAPAIMGLGLEDVGQDVVYLDDPTMMDFLSGFSTRSFFFPYSRFSHQWNLWDKLLPDINQESIINTILAEKDWDELKHQINLMCDGELIEDQGYAYSEEGMKKPLDLEGLSTGMKSILLLKTLLKNGNFNDIGVMIFDEPEIHLHPEWQFNLAKILVLLPKVFDVKLLISTHSSDFLSAIDYYTCEYDMRESTKFYLLQKEDGYSVAEDVTDEIDKVYNSLSRPFLQVAGKL